MPNYATIASDLTSESVDILAAFTDAQAELGTKGAPDTYFLEINFSSSRVRRNLDNARVDGLSQAEQLRLYPQLGGLFNLAMRNLLYP
jgi:hypothetical protein